MEADAVLTLKALHADGGMVSNKFVMQSIANLLQKNVSTIGMPDVSALGAALLAGLKVGVYANIEALKAMKKDNDNYQAENDATVMASYQGWQNEIRQFKTVIKKASLCAPNI